MRVISRMAAAMKRKRRESTSELPDAASESGVAGQVESEFKNPLPAPGVRLVHRTGNTGIFEVSDDIRLRAFHQGAAANEVVAPIPHLQGHGRFYVDHVTEYTAAEEEVTRKKLEQVQVGGMGQNRDAKLDYVQNASNLPDNVYLRYCKPAGTGNQDRVFFFVRKGAKKKAKKASMVPSSSVERSFGDVMSIGSPPREGVPNPAAGAGSGSSSKIVVEESNDDSRDLSDNGSKTQSEATMSDTSENDSGVKLQRSGTLDVPGKRRLSLLEKRKLKAAGEAAAAAASANEGAPAGLSINLAREEAAENPAEGAAAFIGSADNPGRESWIGFTKKASTGTDADGNGFVNQYTVIKRLGAGSYGRVKLCKSSANGELYAIKVVDKRFLLKRGLYKHMFAGEKGKSEDDSSALEPLRREVAVMKKLSHRNVVRLFEVIADERSHEVYLVQEYVTAGSLRGHFPLEEDAQRRIFRDVVCGLEYLHAVGIIHRDIKPDNILLEENQTAKVGDFGVAAFMKAGRASSSNMVGTPAFMAPELLSADDDSFVYTPATDMWALGVTLHMMALEAPPFDADTVPAMYRKIQEQELELPEECDPKLRDLLQGLLHKDPEKRLTLEQVKQHPWVTSDGEDPLPDVEAPDVSVTEADLDSSVHRPQGDEEVLVKKQPKMRVRRRESLRRQSARLNGDEAGADENGSSQPPSNESSDAENETQSGSRSSSRQGSISVVVSDPDSSSDSNGGSRSGSAEPTEREAI